MNILWSSEWCHNWECHLVTTLEEAFAQLLEKGSQNAKTSSFKVQFESPKYLYETTLDT
jgi:hypothetical protein